MEYSCLLKQEAKSQGIFPIFIITIVILIAQLPIEPPMRWYIGIASFIFLLIVSDLFNIRVNPRLINFFLIWILLGIVILISASLNGENRQILSGIWFMLFVPLIYFITTPKFLNNNILTC